MYRVIYIRLSTSQYQFFFTLYITLILYFTASGTSREQSLGGHRMFDPSPRDRTSQRVPRSTSEHGPVPTLHGSGEQAHDQGRAAV